jgi:hypothetical protein
MPDVDMLGVTTYDVHIVGAVKLSFSVGATLSFRLSLTTISEKQVTY